MKKISKARRQNRALRPVSHVESIPKPGQDADFVSTFAVTDVDHGLLARARTQWYVGDWQKLVQIDPASIEGNVERDRLALIIACAYQHVGDHERARIWIRRALAWGCSKGLITRLLISGLHNTMGRIAALRDDANGLALHFEQTMSIVGEKDPQSASHARAVRELTALGLLPQAASLLNSEIDKLSIAAMRPAEMNARLNILKTEVELLHHELSLAQQRNQLNQTNLTFSNENQSESFEEALKRRSPSQLGQDLWVLERSSYKRGGFFVEFGATDGVVLSNTLLLEREFGWHGICAEPNPKFYHALQTNRRCILSNACVGAYTGEEVDFILADAYGGMDRYADEDFHADKRAAYRDMGEVIKVSTTSLDDLLRKLGAPRDIDYLSIDTEGSELKILEAFPYDSWNIRLITVEHNFTPARVHIRRLLEKQGYRCTECVHDDFYERIA
jgi:FkbM family methyltransferase